MVVSVWIIDKEIIFTNRGIVIIFSTVLSRFFEYLRYILQYIGN